MKIKAYSMIIFFIYEDRNYLTPMTHTKNP